MLIGHVVGAALIWSATQTWHGYEIRDIDVVLDLPTPPRSLTAKPGGDARVWEAAAEKVAVVVAAFAVVPAAPEQDSALIGRAMHYLQSRPDLENLKYEVTPARGGRERAWQVAGTFRRGGAPGRVVGVFVADADRIRQVLCFFSDRRGAAMARRILRSTEFRL